MTEKEQAITIDLPMEETFDCPVGTYGALLYDVKLKPEWEKDEIINQIRLVFELRIPGASRSKRYLAGKNFHQGSRQLRQFLERWLGDRLMEGAVDGKLDLRAHIGRPAELVITHHTNPNFKKPFVNIEAISPPNTLSLTIAKVKDRPNKVLERANTDGSVAPSVVSPFDGQQFAETLKRLKEGKASQPQSDERKSK